MFTYMTTHQAMLIIFSLVFGATLALPILGECPKKLFQCANGRCVPLTAICDGVNNCGDGTDELLCQKIQIDVDPSTAAVAAAQYILSKRNSDGDWGSLTPRANVALSFIDENYFKISEVEKAAMRKKLNLQLLFLLHKRGIENIPLHTLAAHVNAQFATCQNPFEFEGNDLVEVLRLKVDQAMKAEDLNPILFLSLCLSRDTRIEDADYLINVYDKKNENIGLKALTVIAMSSCRNLVTQNLQKQMKARSQEFIKRFTKTDHLSIYTKALILQAFNAWAHYDENLQKELLGLQATDGSFVDVTTTCVAIPALLKKSWADLQCKTKSFEVKPRMSITSVSVYNPQRNIDYTLVIPCGENKGNHTLRIALEGRKSLYDLMTLAHLQNALYRFEYDLMEGTKKVVSLAGIPNDIESSSSWRLYRRSADSEKDVKESGNIDWLFPEDKDHIIFKLEAGML